MRPQVFGVLFKVILAGHVIDGGCASFTVTVKLHEALFPAASVAVNVLVVVPNGKLEPDGNPAVWVIVSDLIPVIDPPVMCLNGVQL